MKHVFYVHSGITYLISLAAIDYLKIQKSDVIIISCRSVVIDEAYQCLNLTRQEEDITLLPSYGSVGVLKLLFTLRNLDRKIERALHNHFFTLYLPSEKNYLMQYLQSHRLCVRRDFIEEGLLTYRAGFLKPRPLRKSLFGRIKNLLRFPFHLYRTEGVAGSPSDFTIYVGTQTAQHALHSFNVVLLDITSHTQKERKMTIPRFTALFIFDAVVEMNLCSYENFIGALEDFIVEKVPRQNLAIKFHPFQREYAQYLEVFKKYNIEYILLGAEIIPEMMIARNSAVSVYGLSSSVLFYAKEMGNEVHSFSSRLVKRDGNYRNYVNQLIPNSIVEYLELI